MSGCIRINGEPGDSIPVCDRGLAYGDGLFETMRALQGRFPLWSRHMQRLATGCRRLGMAAPDEAFLARECGLVIEGLADAVVRLTLTRGTGPRGYAAPADPQPTIIVQAAPAPPPSRDWYHRGIRVHLCTMRLAAQPRLAGLKHLNRLEQVLARSEWQDNALAEGLMCNMAGQVISATAANLFALIDGRLVTPAVDTCGVAGVGRAEVLAQRHDVAVRPIALDELMQADEIFLSSSVRGIVPVTGVPAWQRSFPLGAHTRALQADWAARGLPPGAPA